MKNIVILGSTGSIGRQTLDVIRGMLDAYNVVGLAGGKNWSMLAKQVSEFQPSYVAMASEQSLKNLKSVLPEHVKPEYFGGTKGLESMAGLSGVDLVVIAITGAGGILPTISAIEAGNNIALANKEALVSAGELIMNLVAKHNIAMLPVDSEHSAVWQCLQGYHIDMVEKIILTASGGPFLGLSKSEMAEVTVDMALNHPNWNMGEKITIDSATLMNKGLEVIEARWLFGLDYDQIEVVIHPQSIIHSAVEFKDGSIIAQMGLPSMFLPIQYALTYPQRVRGIVPRLKLDQTRIFTFEPPDFDKFRSLKLAYDAGKAGGTMPSVLNASNEIAVNAFLQGILSFQMIPVIVEKVMNKHHIIMKPSIEQIMESDLWARKTAFDLINSSA